MREVDGRIGRAGEVITELNRSISAITESSNEISQIIRVIDNIAFQTNILALNAAVEAARAGEAGAGFAVVADEVRNLAQRCAEAAKNTGDLITGSAQKAALGKASTIDITTAIAAITEGASKVKSLVEQAHSGGQEQAKGIMQISTALSRLESLTQRTAANAEENAAAGQLLQSQAGKVLNVVNAIEELAAGDGSAAVSESGRAPGVTSASLQAGAAGSGS